MPFIPTPSSASPAPASPPSPSAPAPAARAIRKPALDFSLTGFVYAMMVLFMGAAAINSQANLLFGVFGLMVGALLVSGIISRLVLRRLRIRRIIPEHVQVGQPATFQYEMRNHKRFWPSFSVTISELDSAEAFTCQPVAYLLHAAARTAAVVPAVVIPRRRGVYELESYQLSTSFPFGFVKRATLRRRRDSLVIYPAIGAVDQRVLRACLSAEQGGVSLHPQRGGTDEFYGIREYRHGESPRFIYWRRSARTGTLVSREMTRVAPPRLMVFVDTHLPAWEPAAVAAVERAIATAASLVMAALEQGVAVGLFAWADGWKGIAPSRGKRHQRDLLGSLARLTRNHSGDVEAMLAAGASMLRAGTTAVLVTQGADGKPDMPHSQRLVIAAASPQAAQWFSFDPATDFAQCVPAGQEPAN